MNIALNKALFVVLILVSVLLASKFNMDPDLLGHVKYGLDTLERGGLLKTDIYSYSAYGTEWINHEWLSELIFGFIYKNSGITGLMFFKMFLNLILMLLIYKIISCQTKQVFEKVVLYLFILLAFASQTLDLRPQMFTFVFSAVYMYMFLKLSLQDGVSSKQLLVFPVVMLFWANLHGGFLAGIGMFLLFFIGDSFDRKRPSPGLAAVFSLIIISTLINPYAFKLYKRLYYSVTNNSCISEWGFLSMGDNVCQWALIGFAFLVLVLSQKRKTVTQAVFIFVTAFAGIKQVKLFPFFILSCAFILPSFFEDLLRRQFKVFGENNDNLPAVKKAVVLICFAVLLWLVIPQTAFNLRHPLNNTNSEYPVEAVKFIKEHAPKSNVLSHYDWAQYCIWHLYPAYRMFYDGRFRTVYGPDIEKAYFDFHFAGRYWYNLLKQYPPDIILWKQGMPVVSLLRGNKGWKEIYSDKKSVVFVKESI